ncbi:bifunctional diguanylate cyclase/phosphodiesterase [Azohydromonas caseinilytica]|uniref:EAL domain-containing protein n=1 Tax=Azohydromonas caseinilytica TaxID=2728836 RepID=A0A848FGE7_9BURK|nr:EAL domain-containing protein [Azohydromonas caseinilytica]NML17925.1 EAL domain-containing protein [Azohydromonas caseinilytica]
MKAIRSRQDEHQRLERALRTLSGCNRALLRAKDETTLLQEICRVVVEEGRYCLVRIGRAEHDEARTVSTLAYAGSGLNEAEVRALWWDDSERGHSATGTAIRTGALCLVNDMQAHDYPPMWRDFARRRGLGSVLALPLYIEGELFGALSIGAPEADAFGSQELQVLREVADDVAFGLEFLRLRQRREQAEAEVLRLNRALRTRAAVNRALAQAGDEASLLQEICRVAVEECGYRLAWVGYIEADEARTMRPMAHAGFEDGFLALRRSLAASKIGRTMAACLDAQRPMVMRDVTRNPAYPFREEARRRGYGSLVTLPLRVDGELMGSVQILAAETDGFEDQEVQLLEATVADLGYGLAALRQRLRAVAAEETVRRLAYFDPVTGLPNRARVCQLLSQALEAARSERRSLAVVRIGLAHLQELNATLGSTEVDKLVQAVATRLQQAVGDSGTLGRLTESEFALLLPRAGAEPATLLAQRLLAALDQPVDVSGVLLDARSTAGISLFPGHGTEADELLRRAGIALTHARATGAAVAIFKSGFDRDCAQRLALMGELRKAIEHEQLDLYCQPKLKIASGEVCGAEALVRWQHERLGPINPGQFISLAEQTGLITPLTYWMLEAVLRHSYAWRAQGSALPLSVNLSARDLHDPKLLARIEGALATWGAEPDWIEFELTESALMLDPSAALEKLQQLKRLDLRLAIDDYGTGYSSLSYLQRLPVDAIKIDQSFIRGMQRDGDSAAIVHSTIDLAHSLRLLVVAEGVEDQETYSHLAAMACDQAQGYCISRPLPAVEFQQWCAGRA